MGERRNRADERGPESRAMTLGHIRKPNYPGDTIALAMLQRGLVGFAWELGDVRIQDYGGHSHRFRVGTFLPGMEEWSPGDTPKVWPEVEEWFGDRAYDDAVEMAEKFIRDALYAGWVPYIP